MDIDFDLGKNNRNMQKHGISLAMAAEFGWDTAFFGEDTRHDYGERRWIAVGFIGLRLHVMIYTVRGELVRVISLRKANKREQRSYEKKRNR